MISHMTKDVNSDAPWSYANINNGGYVYLKINIP